MKSGIKSAITWAGGALLGAVSGFFGGGGGMLCVPLLELSGLDTKRAHATALLVMLPVCAVSVIVYCMNGYIEPSAALCAVIGVTMGGAAGAVLMNKLPGAAVGMIFALVMIAIGIKLVVP